MRTAALLYAILALGTTLTNSVAETVLASATIPANGFQAGKVYNLRCAVLCPSTNATDTLTCKIRVGPTTLTGTTVVTVAAVDVANNDVTHIDVEFTVFTVTNPATAVNGTLSAYGHATALGAEGAGTARTVYEALTLDTTVAQLIELTGQWSVASASNQARAVGFTLREVAPS